jgi:hypothetical protein
MPPLAARLLIASMLLAQCLLGRLSERRDRGPRSRMFGTNQREKPTGRYDMTTITLTTTPPLIGPESLVPSLDDQIREDYRKPATQLGYLGWLPFAL